MQKKLVKEAESKCVNQFKQYFGNLYDSIVIPEDLYSSYDLIVNRNNKRSLWELKCMTSAHTEYKSVGYIIDTNKFHKLIQLSQTETVFYCMFWSDKVATVWNFNRIKETDYQFKSYLTRFSTSLTTNGDEKTGAYLLSYNSSTTFTI